MAIKKINIFFKTSISFGAFYYIYISVEPGVIRSILERVRVDHILAAFVVYISAQFASSKRFQYVVEGFNEKISFISSLRLHFLGLWFNQVMPSGIGGDLFKLIRLKEFFGYQNAFKFIFLDRLSGFAILLLSVFILLPFYLSALGNFPISTVLIVLVECIFLFFCVGLIALKVAKYFAKSIYLRVSNFLVSMLAFANLNNLWSQFWTSSIVHFFGILTYAQIALSIGVDVSLFNYILTVPLIFLISLLPLSFAGWGVRELAAVSIFGYIGIEREEAFIISVMYGILLIIVSLPGIIVFLNKSNVKVV
jgi:uncharacterized protein (TIRG00374 family)